MKCCIDLTAWLCIPQGFRCFLFIRSDFPPIPIVEVYICFPLFSLHTSILLSPLFVFIFSPFFILLSLFSSSSTPYNCNSLPLNRQLPSQQATKHWLNTGG